MPRNIEPPNATAAALVDIAERNYKAPETEPQPRIPIPQPAEMPPPPIPFAKNNNNGEEPRREALARGLMQFDVLKAERDQLDKDLVAAREKIHLLEIHINELEGTRGTIESRINTCVLERDQAVREAGELRGALNAVAAICAKYHVEEQD